MGVMKRWISFFMMSVFIITLVGVISANSFATNGQQNDLSIALPDIAALRGSPLAPTSDWEDQIRTIEQRYAYVQTEDDSIVFIGSSSIRRWDTLEQDFPGYPVVNAGFGGSHIVDSVYYADRIVIPFNPHTVVFFAGSNDINAGKSPSQVLADYVAFVDKVHEALPDTRIVFISISTSPRRWEQRHQVVIANELIRLYSETDDRLAYVNIYDPMLGEDGLPLAHLYVSDELHMSADGYDIWVEALQPYFSYPYQDVWLTQAEQARDDSGVFALQVNVAPDIAVESVELALAGQVLYRAEHAPTEPIQLDAVPDGRHTATLTVQTVDGKTLRRSYAFTIQNTTIHQPHGGDVLQDQATIKLSTHYAAERIAYVTVSLVPVVFGDAVEDESLLLYRGKTVQERLGLNTKSVSDGAYDLLFAVITEDGVQSQTTQRVVIRNWTSLTDAFDPPQDLAWFGLSERKQTIYESAGWDYATGNTHMFFGDDQRRVWLGEGEGQLIWKVPNVHRYELVLYTTTLDLGALRIEVSHDEQQWHRLLARSEHADANDDGWHKVVLSGQVPAGIEANYVRVTLGENAHDDVFQLGQAKFVMPAKD